VPYYADWEQTVQFHGHICPGIVVGHRACWYARNLLKLDQSSLAPTHHVVAENDLCGIDAFQLNTGCTLGNDNLIINNQGKQAFSLLEKKSGKGVRLVLHVPLWSSNEPLKLHHKFKLGTASQEEIQEFIRLRKLRGEELLELSDEELFKVEFVQMNIPGKPRLYPAINCSRCGEQVMEPWATERNSEKLCSACVE